MGEANFVKTICGYCGTGCGLILEVQDNKIKKIRGDKDAPVNKGQTCVKGAFAYEYVHAKNRLKKPLIRKAGELVETTWDRGLSIHCVQIIKYQGTMGSKCNFDVCLCQNNERIKLYYPKIYENRYWQ